MRLCLFFPALLLIGCEGDAWESDISIEDELAAAAEFGDQLPPPGPLELVVGQVMPNETTTMTVTNVGPGETVFFIASKNGINGNFCPGPLGGQCLDLESPRKVMESATEQGGGWVSVDVSIPGALAVGDSLGWQAAVADGVDSVVSNAVLTQVSLVFCTFIYMPVCGVDGITYSNDCVMGAAGMAEAYNGPC